MHPHSLLVNLLSSLQSLSASHHYPADYAISHLVGFVDLVASLEHSRLATRSDCINLIGRTRITIQTKLDIINLGHSNATYRVTEQFSLALF